MNKLKNIIFHITAVSIFMIGLYLSYLLGGTLLKPQDRNLILEVFITFLLFCVWNLITIGAIGSAILKEEWSIFNYPLYIKNVFNTKWVYHSNLGYFPIVIKANKVNIYKQGFLILKNVGEIDTRGGVEAISERIKAKLDWLYQDHLFEKKMADEEKVRRGEIMKWDGYLDIASRRDKKIKDILK